MGTAEAQTQEELIEKLVNVNCEDRRKIRDRTSLEKNVRDKSQMLDHVKLTGGEVQWLLDAVVIADPFTASCTLGRMITRYMALVAGEQKLLRIRPCQSYAVKNIVECVRDHASRALAHSLRFAAQPTVF